MEVLLHKSKTGEPIGTITKEMGHPQPAIPMQTEKCTTYRVYNNKVQQKHTKYMDVSFIGYRIEFSREIKIYFGNLVLQIWPTVSPNIIRLIIISKCGQCISTSWILQLVQLKGCVIQPRTISSRITQIINGNHKQTRKPGTYGQTDGQTDGLTCGNNSQQLKCRYRPTNIHLSFIQIGQG